MSAASSAASRQGPPEGASHGSAGNHGQPVAGRASRVPPRPGRRRRRGGPRVRRTPRARTRSLHLSMHLSISEQCSIDQPRGIRQAVELLAAAAARCTTRTTRRWSAWARCCGRASAPAARPTGRPTWLRAAPGDARLTFPTHKKRPALGGPFRVEASALVAAAVEARLRHRLQLGLSEPMYPPAPSVRRSRTAWRWRP
jgi:hypothetical protein